jgi:hypothetical protein
MATNTLVVRATVLEPLCRSSASLARIDFSTNGFVAQRCGNAVFEANQPTEREVR